MKPSEKRKPNRQPSKYDTALNELLRIGHQMSNVIFNLGQNDGPMKQYKDLQVQWDRARRRFGEVK